jgi:N-acetylneuraminic acid mutarotase
MRSATTTSERGRPRVGLTVRMGIVAAASALVTSCASLDGLTGGDRDGGPASGDSGRDDGATRADALARHDAAPRDAAKDVRPREASATDAQPQHDASGPEDGDGGCGACKAGQRCVAGQCVCDTESCAGCCQGTACMAGTESAACGIGGEACAVCNASHSCVSAGTCTGGSVVLFGGVTSGTDLQYGDTWVFNGSTWTNVPVVGPTARNGSNAATLPDGKVLLFGGFDGNDNFDDTWMWNGAAWTQVASTGPSVRNVGAMATLGGAVVLFGGFDNEDLTCLGDTWTWASGAWTATGATGPSARLGAAFAAVDSFLVLFGGQGPGVVDLGDTWLWNGSRWDEVSGSADAGMTPTPNPRDGAAAVALGGELVLFGGADGSKHLGDLWSWNGEAWTSLAPHGMAPTARSYAAAAVLGGRMIVFGGEDDTGTQSDTWAWDGTSWKLVVPSGGGPPARYYAAMAAQSF